MYKKLIPITITALMLLTAVGCVSQPNNGETVDTTPSGYSTEATDATIETVPGIVDVETPIQNPLDDETDPTDASVSETPDPSETPTETTEATAPSEESTEPSEEATEPEETTPSTTPDSAVTSYEAYNAMSPDEQLAFYNTFESMEDFVAWYNAAKAEYDAQNPDIEIGDGNIDMDDIIGGGN